MLRLVHSRPVVGQGGIGQRGHVTCGGGMGRRGGGGMERREEGCMEELVIEGGHRTKEEAEDELNLVERVRPRGRK